ncbi:hypothetical protein ACLMAJ_17845 [Nocardia sp. KC 131]|uniref:hypothetical protein n=1 Tax=Nocardia arseniciresistens TaxID=3392119 RepID=UPI00398E7E40
MVKMQYLRSGIYLEHGREHQDGVDLATVSRGDLRWYYFLSGLSFHDRRARTGSAVIVDAGVRLPVVDKGCAGRSGAGRAFDGRFTENAELIVFTPEAEKVRISAFSKLVR